MVQTDGGSQFTSTVCQGVEFQHTISSPYNSRSNGKTESVVKIAKRILKRNKDPYMALLEWRNTPTEGRDSTPAQRLLARRTRAAVPVSLKKLVPEAQTGMWESKINQQKNIQAQNFRGGLLPALRIGQPVLVQDVFTKKTQWSRGRCVNRLSYIVETEGRLLHRNRQLLRPSENQPESPPAEDHIPPEERLDPNTEETNRQDGENQSVGHAEPMPLTTSSQERPPTREAVQSTTRSGWTVQQPQWFGSYVKH